MMPFERFLLIGALVVNVLLSIGLYSIDNEVNDLKSDKETTTTTSSTTTTFRGIKCMVNGFVINTDLANAKDAGCK